MVSRTFTLLLLITLTLTSPGSEASTITVNSTSDVLSDDGFCTLREAVIASNTDTPSGAMIGECITGAGIDTIVLQSETYTLTIAGTGEDNALTGDLDLLDSVQILGAGQQDTVVDGNDLDRVFEIDASPAISVSMSDLTIRDGATTGDGGGIYNLEVLDLVRVSLISNSAGSDGGAVFNWENLSLTDCLVTENSADSRGGGILNEDLASLSRSVVTVNSSGSSGGGFRNNGDLNITDSTISFNTSEDGGGISNPFPYTMTLAQSTVMENVASDDGGGIWNGGEVTIHNSTVSGNLAGDEGGGIYSNESVDIRNSTLFGNSATQGSAVSNREDAFVGNTILGGTCSGTDILLSLGGNIESPGDTCGLSHASDQVALTTKDLSLGPLSDNGGHTLTHAPLYPSAAIDAGINGTCLPKDQRGVQRPNDGDGDGFEDCDVGSVESDDLIFTDGFESGNTSAWSRTVQ